MIDISFEEEMAMLRYWGYDADAQMYEDAHARAESERWQKEHSAVWLYGMRLRGFSIGCQPKKDFIERLDDESGKYYDILVYWRPLTEQECENYDLDFLGIKEYCEVMPSDDTIQ